MADLPDPSDLALPAMPNALPAVPVSMPGATPGATPGALPAVRHAALTPELAGMAPTRPVVSAPLAPAELPGPPEMAALAPARKRPRPGERRVQILQTLAGMLEQPGAERITTAALAARLQVSEAALYRHFASKAQMFEGLIEFIESSVFTLVNQITERESDGPAQARRIVGVLLQFGEKNPGMVRVMVGDALVFEHERLILRMNQFFDRLEGQLRQSLRLARAGEAASRSSANAAADAAAVASGLVALAMGRLQRYARSGFKRSPTEHLEPVLARLVG
jgi:TetR/AcrR family transcriptional regulator